MISCRLEKDAYTVGLWHFFEGSGTTAKDYSGNLNHGTVYGATYVDSLLGKGLSFDGVDDYVNVADSASLDITSKITIEAVIYADNPVTSTGKGVVTKVNEAPAGECYMLGIHGDPNPKIYWYLVDSSYTPHWIKGNTTITSQWVYIAGVYDGAALKVFLNGIDDGVSSSQNPTGSFQISISSQDLKIGVLRTYYFGGKINCVRISNIARSAAEIKYNWLRMPQILTA